MAKGTKTKLKPRKVGPVTEVASRDIKPSVRCMLWGRSAARCEFSGCNRPLSRSPVTQEQVNIAEAAHIYAFSTQGPRGNDLIENDKLNEVDNLMLVCADCHKTMDNEPDGGRYTVELLKKWKQQHEARVEIVTGVDPKKSSHVLLYGANIGDHSSPLNFADAAQALFPHRYPADGRAIELSTSNSSFRDRDAAFWAIESERLKSVFGRKVFDRVDLAEIQHLSVFGLAPQPLLILLGTLIGDITPADVYQRHREPVQTWEWPDSSECQTFQIKRPPRFDGTPALVLGLSASITRDRIESMLGPNVSIWNVQVPNPSTSHIRSRGDLSSFRALMGPLFDEIKSIHGQATPLHIFPAASVSVTIELGRLRMPKALTPWIIYDQVNEQNGFIRAITIP